MRAAVAEACHYLRAVFAPAGRLLPVPLSLVPCFHFNLWTDLRPFDCRK